MHRILIDFRSHPHLFDVVEFPDLGAEYVNDDVSGVDQDPVTIAKTFNFGRSEPSSFQIAQKVIADGRDMTVRTTGRYNHVVAQCRFSRNVDGDNVFRLGFLEAGEDQFQRMKCSSAAFQCG